MNPKFGLSRPHMDEDLEVALDLVSPQIVTALDLGCGLGKMGRVLRSKNPLANIVGVDANPEIVNFLQRDSASPYREVHNMEILDALTRLGQFDMIMAGDVLEHLDPNQLDKTLSLIQAQARFALIIGPIQDLNSLDTSTKLRSGLPTWERHLTTLDPEIIAKRIGEAITCVRRDTVNSVGNNPYQKFCLLAKHT